MAITSLHVALIYVSVIDYSLYLCLALKLPVYLHTSTGLCFCCFFQEKWFLLKVCHRRPSSQHLYFVPWPYLKTAMKPSHTHTHIHGRHTCLVSHSRIFHPRTVHCAIAAVQGSPGANVMHMRRNTARVEKTENNLHSAQEKKIICQCFRRCTSQTYETDTFVLCS